MALVTIGPLPPSMLDQALKAAKEGAVVFGFFDRDLGTSDHIEIEAIGDHGSQPPAEGSASMARRRD